MLSLQTPLLMLNESAAGADADAALEAAIAANTAADAAQAHC